MEVSTGDNPNLFTSKGKPVVAVLPYKSSEPALLVCRGVKHR